MTFKRNKEGISVLREATAADVIKAMTVPSFDDEAKFPGQNMKNMLCRDGALECIAAPVMCSAVARGGRCVSVVDGNTLYFSAGRDICRVNEDGTFSLIGANILTTEAGKAYAAGGKVIFTEGSALFSARNNTVIAEEPYIPCVVSDCTDDGRTYTVGEKMNILTAKVNIEYDVSYDNTRVTPQLIKLASVDGIYFPNGTKMATSNYSVTIDGIGQATITLVEETSQRLTVRGTVRQSEISAYSDAASAFTGNAPMCEVYSTEGGKTVLTFDRKTLYLFDLVGSTYIPCQYTTVDTDEEITAVLPYDDGWFVFTQNTIKRLEITDGAMTLKPFKRDFGCDMPQSAVSERDKVIFADKDMGIYYIDRYNVNDKDVSRRISANIDGMLREIDPDEMENAAAIVACGKYYLFCKDKIFVWDQMKKTPSAAQNTEADEKKLVWYKICGIGDVKPIGALGEKVFFCGEDGTGYFVCREADGDSLEGEFSSGRLDAGKVGVKTAESISIHAKTVGKSTMEVIADGKITPYKFTFCGEGEEKTYTVRLPAKKFNSIGFKINGKNLTLYGYEIKYYEG